MEPGIYDISSKDYHASLGISKSAISYLKRSPLHYWERYVSPDKKSVEQTDAMILGSALHTLLLEPYKFTTEFSIFEPHEMSPYTAIAKEHKRRFYEENSNKIVISKENFLLAQEMVNATLSNKKVNQILAGAQIEKSLFWYDEDINVLCKSRPDIWNKELDIICDIKTSSSNDIESFKYSLSDYDYDIQAAMQKDSVKALTGKEPKHFVFIVIQKTPPYMPYIYDLSDHTIEFGRSEYKSALKILKRCLEENCWTKDRETILPIQHTHNKSRFYNLMEIYQCLN